MDIRFTPSQQDIQYYRRLRAAGMALNGRILKTAGKRAFEEVGEALGIFRHGVLLFDNEDMTSVMADCCLYDWFEDGRNVVERYVEAHPPQPGTEESELLGSYLQSVFRIVIPKEVLPGAGLYCVDILNGGELFLMDIGLSRSVPGGCSVFGARTMPLGGFWMTSGAGLPVTPGGTQLGELCERALHAKRPANGAGGPAVFVLRQCLAAGAAEHVAYEDPALERPTRHKRPSLKLGRRWRRH